MSKVTFTASVLEEINEDERVLHSRRVTLLFQAHKSSGVAGLGGSAGPQMSKLTFTNVFDSHTPEEIQKLDRVYAECHGKLPSRRQLSAIAQAINVQQSKIKKWFDKRAGEAEKEQNRAEIDGSDTFWTDLNAKMDEIDDRIHKLYESRQFEAAI